MSESQHDLAAEFPKYKDRIHTLKTENAHFRKLYEEYHEVTKKIARSEQRVDTLTEIEEERLRKQRLTLKDELYSMMSKPE
ncbi:MAG: DUF465 domain-containing protein [Bdellovibrionota bacterium]